MDTNENTISRATEEITLEARSARMSRERCPLLYELIEDGNAGVVDAVMARLEHKERKWILGIKDSKERDVTSSQCFILSAWLIVTAIAFVLLTPVFYVIHGIITSGYRFWRMRDRRRFYPLPLFSAVSSGNLDVASVLLTYGAEYTQADDHLNNVLHHLSLVSSDDPSTTLRCYQAVREVLKGEAYRGALEKLLLARNKDGLRPAEHCALYGNPQLCGELVNDTHVLTERPTCNGSNKENVQGRRNPENDSLLAAHSDIERRKAADSAVINDANSDTKVSDGATMSGRIQSSVEATVLHFLSTRDVQEFEPQDIQSVRKCRPLRSLAGRTLWWCWTWSAIYHLLQAAFTVLYIWEMIDSGRDNNPYPNLLKYAGLYTDAIPFLVARKDLLRFMTDDCTEDLLAQNSCYWEAVKDLYWKELSDMSASCESHDSKESAYITDDELYLTSGAVLLHETSTIDNVLEKLILFDTIGKICLILATLSLVLDILFRVQYALRRRSLLAVWLFRLPGSYTERQLSILMYIFFVGFFVYSFGYAQDVTELVEYMESRFVILSETANKRQMDVNSNNTTNTSNILDEIWTQPMVQKINETRPALEAYVDRSGYILVTCLVLRCVLTVYAMRLLPTIGLFVITTKRMIQHLIEFYCVFFVIQIAVACTFHYLIRSRPCLPEVMEGYETFSSAVYSTFMLAANPGTFQLKRENLSTRVLMVVFLIMMAIFLLNLITAVMTAAVMSLAQTGRRRFLCEQEYWKELIGVQAMSHMVVSFWRQNRCKRITRQESPLQVHVD